MHAAYLVASPNSAVNVLSKDVSILDQLQTQDYPFNEHSFCYEELSSELSLFIFQRFSKNQNGSQEISPQKYLEKTNLRRIVEKLQVKYTF